MRLVYLQADDPLQRKQYIRDPAVGLDPQEDIAL